MLFMSLGPADTVKKKVNARNLCKAILKPTSYSYCKLSSILSAISVRPAHLKTVCDIS